MFAEVTCKCDCSFQVDAGDDADDVTNAWALVNRFADAHVACGYMTPPAVVLARRVRTRMVRPTSETDDEDE